MDKRKNDEYVVRPDVAHGATLLLYSCLIASGFIALMGDTKFASYIMLCMIAMYLGLIFERMCKDE